MAKYKMNSVWEHKIDKHKVRIVGKSSHFIKISTNPKRERKYQLYKHGNLLTYKIFKETYQLALRGVLSKL